MKKILRTILAVAMTCTTVATNAATLNEGFEKTKANGSYYTTATSFAGDACTWSLLDCGVFANEGRTGTNSLRLSTKATSSLTMSANKSGGAGTVSFYAHKWVGSTGTADANATIEVQYSTNSGSSWTTAGNVTVSATSFTKYNVTVNKTGNIRIKLAQTAGKRVIIDDISITDYTTTTTSGITSPTNNSTVNFGSLAVNEYKVMSVVVKGSGLTSATSVAVSGTGFSANTTSLSASKVNSSTGGTVQVTFKGTSAGSKTGKLTLQNGTSTITVNLSATVTSSSSTTTPTFTSPTNGSTVDFGTTAPSTTKTMSVVVKGSGMTSATSVSVAGTGFAANTATLSASKVNSTAGSTLQLNFKAASAGTYNGTLTLANGSKTIKVNLKAVVSGTSSGTTTSPTIKTPASGSTVDFGTATPGTNKTTTIVVTGANLTSAITVTVSGTGFRSGATTLSTTKVNSATGAQLQLIFNSSAAGSHTGTLTLTSGTLSRKVSLKATVSDGGTTAVPESNDNEGSGSGSGSGTSQTGATNNNIPSGYYKNAEGKCGAALLSALCNIVSSHTSVSYANLWTAYKQTDTKSNGKIWDMYSTKEFTYSTDQCGNYTTIGVCYNREHSFPKSWFKDATPMYTDLFHIYPTDGFVNNQRGNAPFGECAGGTYVAAKNGVSAKGKLGKSTLSGYSGTVWEPDDDYKGDFARSYFYMAAAYNTKIAGWTSDMLNKTSYPAFSDWAINMLLRWNALDPVSTKETARQEAVYAKQKNRNPFIDYPDLADYIWGSKKTTAWSASAAMTSRISQPANGATLNFGTVATGATNEKIVAVKGASVTDNVSVSVQGDGFEASAEWLDASAVNSKASAAASARGMAKVTEADPDGALLKITFLVPNQSNYTGTLILKSGSITNTVHLEGKALDGLPAADAENIGADSFTARWVNVGDALPGGYYSLDVTDDGVSLPGYPINVDADALTYVVTDLQPEHDYEYSLSNATTESNIISVTTGRLKPSIEYMVIDDDTHLITSPGTPSSAIGIDLDIENMPQDITFSVQAPFQVSADNVNWDREAIVNADAAQVYVRLGSTTISGSYLTSLRATSGDFTDDAITIMGEVTSTGGNAVYFLEDFEADATGCGSYKTKTYNGNGSTWKLSNSLLQKASTEVFYEGTYSLRLGKDSLAVAEMLEDAIAPQSTISFYAAKWNAKEAQMTLGVDFSDDNGKTWTNAKTVVISNAAATPGEYTYVTVPLNNSAQGRIRIRKEADGGGRGFIDYITAVKGSSAAESIADNGSDSWKVYSPAYGEISVTTAEPTQVTIVGVDGKVYYSASVSGSTTVSVPSGQLYIVTAPGKYPRRLVP